MASFGGDCRGFSVVVSLDPATNGIGRGGQLPWRVKEDMAFFKEITSTAPCGLRNAVIMGRKTWESIPAKFRPLEQRLNIVLSTDEDVRSKYSVPDSVLTAASLEGAMSLLRDDQSIAQVFVIGGESLYREALASPLIQILYITEIFHRDHSAFSDLDTFFPFISANRFQLQYRSNKRTSSSMENLSYRFVQYRALPLSLDCDDQEYNLNSSVAVTPSPSQSVAAPVLTPTSRNLEELQYLELVKDIIATGVLRGDRTGTGTLSKFGVQMRFSLRNRVLPLITTKRVFWRAVAEELLWFVKGSTNAKELQDKNIHIWDGNASRQFLDSRGLHHREEGDLGPVYGFQWRHFGAKYVDMHTDYSGQGFDQLLDCIDKIKNVPEDRRILMSAWNPADLHLMALPPCHMFCQFYVANGELSCHVRNLEYFHLLLIN
jgi:dihydrofolate reductase/thymidylate synthase